MQNLELDCAWNQKRPWVASAQAQCSSALSLCVFIKRIIFQSLSEFSIGRNENIKNFCVYFLVC